MKLFDQYCLLYRRFDGAEAEPGLAALAGLLGCSERNVRLQLAKMRARGWIDWQAGRGRGRRSRLRFVASPPALRLGRLQQLIEQGEMEQAFASLDGALRQALVTRLPELLGARPVSRELRIALYRAPQSLDPLAVSSRLESHLVRHLFDRLCGFDRQRDRLVPGLAHDWSASPDGRRWRFWLRPDLRFHDGSVLDAPAVAASVLRLRDGGGPYSRQYRHLQAAVCDDALSLTFVLDRTDWLWPNRLVTANASIVPPRRGPDFAWLPVGSGPFSLERHNALRLSLRANPHYYRERPLLARIDLWILPEDGRDTGFDVRFSTAPSTVGAAGQIACNYLLLNRGRLGLDARGARRLMRFFGAPSPVADDDPLRRPAAGLWPGWRQPLPDEIARCDIPAGRSLTLVCYELAGFQTLAAALARRLAGAGVRLAVRTLDFPAFVRHDEWLADADLVLSSEMPHDDLDYATHEWLGGSLLLRRLLDPAARGELDRRLAAIECEPCRAARQQGFRALGDWLVGGGWLLPLSHERQLVLTHPEVAGLEMGENGWMDFTRLWLKT